MKLPNLLKKRYDQLLRYDGDHINAQKNMINNIQKVVGVHNVFGDSNRGYSIIDVISTILFTGCMVYVAFISQIIYLVQVFPDKLECFKVFNSVSASILPFSKYIFMATARPRLRTIFKMLREGLCSIPAGSSAHSRMLATLDRSRYVSWLVLVSQASAFLAYLLIPFVFTVFGNDRYLPSAPGDTYGLSPTYETPNYELTYITLAFATIFAAINQTGYIILFMVLIAHELGHFYSITETMNDIHRIITEENNDGREQSEIIDEKLKFSVKHHQFLHKLHDRIRELYRLLFGAHFMLMTIILITTLQTLNNWDKQNTILTGVIGILPLFIYCFGGEMLLSAGDAMSTAVYSSGWEQMEVKQARVVLLMLCLTQRPLHLTAANIFVMNRDTFGIIVQVVYKVYTVFNV